MKKKINSIVWSLVFLLCSGVILAFAIIILGRLQSAVSFDMSKAVMAGKITTISASTISDSLLTAVNIFVIIAGALLCIAILNFALKFAPLLLRYFNVDLKKIKKETKNDQQENS